MKDVSLYQNQIELSDFNYSCKKTSNENITVDAKSTR